MMMTRAQRGMATATLMGCLFAAERAPAEEARHAPAQSARQAALCLTLGSEEIQADATRLVQMADTDGDGRVSKQEALGASNFIVGGLFFRADADSDGVITPEEGRDVRREIMNGRPMVAALIKAIRSEAGRSPFEAIARMLDVDYGKPLQASEAREAMESVVESVFAIADQNADGSVTGGEASRAAAESVGMMGRLAFGAADESNDGTLTHGEFESLVMTPARVAFATADRNDDGKLSLNEARSAMLGLMNQLGVQLTVTSTAVDQAQPQVQDESVPRR